MQKTLLALALIMSSVAFAHSDNSMMESDLVSADQIVKYQDLPQTIILRMRKSRGSWVEAARVQGKLAQDADLSALRFEQISQNYESEVVPTLPQTKVIEASSKTSKKKNVHVTNLMAQQVVPVEPYFFGFYARYNPSEFQAHRTGNCGYPYIRYYNYTYSYLPYASYEDASYIYAFYTWSNFYQ